MKKIIFTILITYIWIFPINIFAADAGETTIMADGTEVSNVVDNSYDTAESKRLSNYGTENQNKSTSAGASKTVIVTEKVPGAECTCIADGAKDNVPGDGVGPVLPGKGEAACNGAVEKRKYQCIVQPGFGSFQTMFAQIIRWFVFIVMLLGVLGIVGLGIAWAWAGGDDVKAKGNLKKWGINIAIGLIILFFFRYILTIIAPWIYN